MTYNKLRYESVRELQQKQPPDVFCKKVVLRDFAKSWENTCARVSFFNKVAIFSAKWY